MDFEKAEVSILKNEFRVLLSNIYSKTKKFPFDKNKYPEFTGLISIVHDLISTLNRSIEDKKLHPDALTPNLIVSLSELYDIMVRFNNNPIPFQENNDLINSFILRLMRCQEQLNFFMNPYEDAIQKENNAINEIDGVRKKTNKIYYEITNSYERLKNDIDKTSNLIDKLNELESAQRKLVSSFIINNDAYKEKVSIIDVAYERVEQFTKSISKYQKNQEHIDDRLKVTLVEAENLKEKVDNIDSTIEAKQNTLDTILRQAEEVLGKASTAALGQFFKEQYEHSQKHLWVWPTMGFAFLSGAISICVITVFPSLLHTNVLLDTEPAINELSFIISRLIVSPLFLIGAWFCASQYVKRKSIIEDYAYKKVLSLSLLSFKAEIEKTGEQNTTEFIRAVQNELIKSPLDSLDKKHHKKETEFLKSIQFEMMSGLLNNAKKALSENSKKDSSDVEPPQK